jgi:hypothetical protein
MRAAITDVVTNARSLGTAAEEVDSASRRSERSDSGLQEGLAQARPFRSA